MIRQCGGDVIAALVGAESLGSQWVELMLLSIALWGIGSILNDSLKGRF
jgi:hypothetical protein